MKNGWQCPKCHEKWEYGQMQPCDHVMNPVKISYMDPQEMIAKYGPPIKPLRKFNCTTLADKGRENLGRRRAIQRDVDRRT